MEAVLLALLKISRHIRFRSQKLNSRHQERGASELFFHGVTDTSNQSLMISKSNFTWRIAVMSCTRTFDGLRLQPQTYCLICDNLLVYGHLTVGYWLIQHTHLNANAGTLRLRSRQASAAFIFSIPFYACTDILVCQPQGDSGKCGCYIYDAKFHPS